MTVSVRAAAFAVASFAVALTATIARPTLAWEADVAPVVSPEAAHAAAAIEGIGQTVNAVEEPASKTITDPFSPVAQHAVAPAAPDAKVLTQPEEEDTVPLKSLSAMVADFSDDGELTAEMECLAGAVYFESKGEPLDGQLAVAEVIINRSKSGRFPSSLCGVVKQRGQFSFVKGGKFPPIARGSAHWRKAVGIAHVAVKDLADSSAENALFFHARRVSPGWKLRRVATVGNHVFYR
jgi:N-acetylmuramoyl-L-alanine amidase